jgi:hypothetical protein
MRYINNVDIQYSNNVHIQLLPASAKKNSTNIKSQTKKQFE